MDFLFTERQDYYVELSPCGQYIGQRVHIFGICCRFNLYVSYIVTQVCLLTASLDLYVLSHFRAL